MPPHPHDYPAHHAHGEMDALVVVAAITGMLQPGGAMMSTQRRQVPAWPRGPRPDRDPDRRPPAPPHPGFAQFPLDIDTDVCARCRALVPATEVARARHAEWDQRMDALYAAINQKSDPGTSAPPGPGSDQTGGEVVGPVATASTAGPPSSRAAFPSATSGEGGEREPEFGVVATSRDRRHDPPSSDLNPTPTEILTPEGWISDDAKEGDALPDNDDEGEGSAVDIGGASDLGAQASADPDPSPVMAWCARRNLDIRLARIILRRNFAEEFADIKDRKDLEELRGERAERAVAYLEASFLRPEEGKEAE